MTAISLKVMQDRRRRVRVGMEVGRVAGLLAAAFADQGADYNFPGHIEVRNASDPRSATLLEGQVVWCDFGVTVAGYHSDISRRAVLGSATASQRESHGKGWRLLETLIQDLKPGRTIAEAMHAMLALRTSIHAGTDEHQRFGHGIGLSAAEPPSLAARELELVEEGMVLTPEPSFTTVGGEFVHLEEMIAIGAKDALLLTGGAATAADRFGRIDAVINNAGITHDRVDFRDLDFEVWRRILEVNLDGAFFTIQFALPHLIRQERGSIVLRAGDPTQAPRGEESFHLLKDDGGWG
jgi:Xaa-Pro aminopeptidase